MILNILQITSLFHNLGFYFMYTCRLSSSSSNQGELLKDWDFNEFASDHRVPELLGLGIMIFKF